VQTRVCTAWLVVLVPLALCAISVMWMVIEVTQLRAAENQRQQADSDPFDLGL
jgi:cell division protein FtsL